MRSSTLTACKWKLPNVSEIQKVCKLWDTDGSHPLHLCFDYSTEYDPDVVFDKNAFCSMLLFLWNLTYIQVLIQILFFKLEIFNFNVLHVQIFMQQNIPWNFSENPLKCCWWLQRCFKNAELKISLLLWPWCLSASHAMSVTNTH